MPRARKGTQPVAAAPGQAYGQGIDQINAQKAVPLPDARTPLAPVSQNSPGVVPSAQPAMTAPATPMSAGLEMMPSPSLLTQPTNRPNEPVTAGLAMGPGAGPDALSGVPANLSAMLRTIAQATGDSYFDTLSQRVQ